MNYWSPYGNIVSTEKGPDPLEQESVDSHMEELYAKEIRGPDFSYK